MNLKTPHIINEGIAQYSLGVLRGNQIHYDFEKILIYLGCKRETVVWGKVQNSQRGSRNFVQAL